MSVKMPLIASCKRRSSVGARGLRSICEAILNDAMFELPSSEEKEPLVLDLDYVTAKLGKMTLSKLKAVS